MSLFKHSPDSIFKRLKHSNTSAFNSLMKTTNTSQTPCKDMMNLFPSEFKYSPHIRGFGPEMFKPLDEQLILFSNQK